LTETKTGFDIVRFGGSVRETLYGVEFSGNLHTGPLPKDVGDYTRIATGLVTSLAEGKSLGDGLTRFATGTLGVELSFRAKLELLNVIPVTFVRGHFGASSEITAKGVWAAPAGAIFSVTAPILGLYERYSKNGTNFEFLGGALVVPSIEALTAGKSGLEAFPTYGYLRSSVSRKVGPGELKFGVEGSLSAKELVAPTPQTLDFNQTYDLINKGIQPDIPAAFKTTATLSYTY